MWVEQDLITFSTCIAQFLNSFFNFIIKLSSFMISCDSLSLPSSAANKFEFTWSLEYSRLLPELPENKIFYRRFTKSESVEVVSI